MPALYEKIYRIHCYEVDFQKKTLITNLMGYFDDAATSQSESLGVGMDYLKKHNLAWVLYKWDITVQKYPTYGEKIKVRTAPHSFNKFYAYRWFEMSDLEGGKLATANSQWLLVDTEKKRPIKVTKYMCEVYDAKQNKALKIEDIKGPTSIDTEKEFHVRYSDIDTNMHVNNAKYATWALETLPLDIMVNYTLKNLKVTYKKETTYGKTIKALTQIENRHDNITCLHSIVDKDEKVLCLLKSFWTKNIR